MKKVLISSINVILILIGLTISGLTYYVNHYLPKGEMYLTRDIACEYDDRVCGYERKENLDGLNIPNWAVYFKGNDLILFFWIFVVLPWILLNTKIDR